MKSNSKSTVEQQQLTVIYLEEGISAGYWTVSGAAETSGGQSQGRGAGGRYCSGPMTAVGPDFQ